MLIILAVLGPIFGNMTGYWPVVLTGVVLTAVVMAMGFTVFSYTAESYPTRMRNTATGFHSSTGRLAVAAAQPLIPDGLRCVQLRRRVLDLQLPLLCPRRGHRHLGPAHRRQVA